MKFKLSKLSSIAEIVGAFAVVISLIYVGVQVNDSTSAIRSAAANDANVAMQSWYLQVGSDQETSSLWLRALTSEEALSDAEEFQFLMMTHAAYLGFQNSYLLAEEGTIDPELREAITSAILGTKDMPGMIRYWRQRKSYLHADFAAYVDELFTRDTVNTVDVYHTQKTEQED